MTNFLGTKKKVWYYPNDDGAQKPGVLTRLKGQFFGSKQQPNRFTRIVSRVLVKAPRPNVSARKALPNRIVSSTFPVRGASKVYTGRGRPKGSLDPRYARYGGVFGYRRAMSAQRQAFRERMKLQQQMIKQRQIQQMQQAPQMEGYSPEAQMQYPQQVPQQYEEQMQYPQQMPPQPQKRPIVPVFKSSGGKPYPSLDESPPLTPSTQTISQGYVESVDLMTGKRFMKKLPQAERWSQ